MLRLKDYWVNVYKYFHEAGQHGNGMSVYDDARTSCLGRANGFKILGVKVGVDQA